MKLASAGRQRGVVSVITGLTIAVLIAFLAISVDLGRLFVMKAELQTAMDACALAAASGLRPGMNDPNALLRAVAFGKAPSDSSMVSPNGPRPASSANEVGFQKMAVDSSKIEFAFGSRLDNVSPGWTDANTARYARCSYPLTGVAVYFIRVLGGATTADVYAGATATLGESAGPACLFPVALCNDGSTTDPASRWGLTPGIWETVVDSGGFQPGWFGWVNLNGGSPNATELSGWIAGDGFCTPEANNLTPGAKQSVETAWNSRFGIYKNGAGNPQPGQAAPDFTGYSYRDLTKNNKITDNWAPDGWTPGSTVINAYSGTDQNADGGSNEPNYDVATKTFMASQYQLSGFSSPLSPSDMEKYGRSRRIVPVPVFNCPASGTPTRIANAYACVLLVHPITQPKDATVEFLGRADEIPGCQTSGGAGGTVGPFVPVLVQ